MLFWLGSGSIYIKFKAIMISFGSVLVNYNIIIKCFFDILNIFSVNIFLNVVFLIFYDQNRIAKNSCPTLSFADTRSTVAKLLLLF